MLYQKLLMGSKPYHAALARLSAFEAHRHPEIELIYCLEGCARIIVSRQELTISAGDLAVIGSMVSHEIPDNESENCRALVVEAGPVLLGEYFEPLSRMNFAHPVLSAGQTGALGGLFRETAGLMESGLPFSELSVRGNVYRICASLLQTLAAGATPAASKSLESVSNIEKALELIENRFDETLTVDSVAALCGYGKSNFCRIFRRVTGETFHALLTRRRVQAAQVLLRETDAALESIAAQTGFADAKSFCRAFRRITDMTPGEYRREKGKE